MPLANRPINVAVEFTSHRQASESGINQERGGEGRGLTVFLLVYLISQTRLIYEQEYK